MASENSINAGELVIGAPVSVISRNGVRYEGTLYFLNEQESTLGLENVRCYGTEGRKRDGPQIPPSDNVHEIVQFSGSDIKELQVKSVPPTQPEEQTRSSSANIRCPHITTEPNEELCHDTVNQKLKKDEPCGYQRKTVMDSAPDKTIAGDSQAVYKKLDTTPCSSHNSGDMNEHGHFYKRIKLDTEISFS